MGYTNLDDAKAGRQARMAAEADQMADRRAESILLKREQSLQGEQQRIDDLAEAEAKGIHTGARTGKMDATRFFAEQGFIPGQIFGEAHSAFKNLDLAADEADGLGMRSKSSDGLAEAQIEDISNKLLQASINGAPSDAINQTISRLRVPEGIKKEAAKRFVTKEASVREQGGASEQPMTKEQSPVEELPGSAVERMNSPVTRYATNLAGQTDSLIQRLHEKMAPKQQQG